MKPEQKKAINRTILKCREILESDIENRLVTYGILLDEPWFEKDKLSLSDEEEQIYKDLRDAISKEMKGGLSEKEALISYIREVTYTYLNRIAALRVMEVRGLMEEVLIQREEYSNRSYGHRNFFEVAREFCKTQSDEGLSYFISLIFNEISSDIGLLFNTEDEYSIIGPSNQALLEIIHQLATEIDEESWQQDEIIGWIYQYFNEEEKDDVFDRLYNKKEKIKSIDIPAATQLFTPDWIVDWIINNSLGKLREEIINGEREHKKLEEIKLLDPACGSGHFLIKAYDLFYNYYVEEGYPKEKIPFLILSNNLHGIDIDARAIQLSALILYIKVRVSLKEAGIKEIKENKITVNLVCADAVLLNGDRLAKMRKQFENNPTVLQMIEIIYDEFTDTRLKGSLVQPEKKLIPLIEKYKQNLKKDLKKRKKDENLGLFEGFDDFEKEQEESILAKGDKDLFQYLEQIYTQAISAKDINNLLFANEAKKSVRLLNIFMQKYDVVVTNPPYMGKQSMNETLKDFVNNTYSDYSNDLYSVFIIRCKEFLDNNGLLGMITQQGFMFSYQYKELRKFILNNTTIVRLVQLGTRAFDDISGEKVNTAMFVFKNKKVKKTDIGQFVRLVYYNSSINKKQQLEKSLRLKENSDDYFELNQNEFKKLEGYPFSFWITQELREQISDSVKFGEYAEMKSGFSTGDKNRFVLNFWEIPITNKKKNWLPCMAGGESLRYWGNLNFVINYDLEEIKKNKGARIYGQDYFFKKGISVSLLSSTGFYARYLPEGYVLERSSNNIFVPEEDIYAILGILNSDIVDFILNIYNQSLGHQLNDLKRLPVINMDEKSKEQINSLTKRNIDLTKKIQETVEPNINFKSPMILNFGKSQGTILDWFLASYNCKLDIEAEIINNQESISKVIKSLFTLSEDDMRTMEREKKIKYEEEIKVKEFDLYIEELVKKGAKKEDAKGKIRYTELDLEAIYNRVDLSIYDLKDLIQKNRLFSNKLLEKEVRNIFSFFIGKLFGRFTSDNRAYFKDGIIVLDNTFMEDYIYNFIEDIFGEENFEKIVDEEIPSILNKDLLSWFQKEFYMDHLSKYANRPIYWHVCSQNKTFNALLYYHALTADTLYKLKSDHLKPMLDNIHEDLIFFREKKSSLDDKKLVKTYEKKITELEKQINDLEEFDKNIDVIIATGYYPNIDEGVLYNLKPLNPILAKKVR